MQGGLPVGIGLEQLTHYGRGGLVHLDQCRIAGPLRMHSIAIWRVGPRQQAPGSQLGQASSSHSVGDKRALVLSDSAADLNHELFVRVVAWRTIDKDDADPMPLEFFENDHLVHVVARKAVRSRHQHNVECCPRGLVTQGVQAWSLELRSTVAIVPENVLLPDNPLRMLRDVHAQERHLLFDRLGLLLPLRRYSDVERCPHDSLLRLAELPPPNAEEAGTRDPTVAAHRARRPRRVRLASLCAPAIPLRRL